MLDYLYGGLLLLFLGLSMGIFGQSSGAPFISIFVIEFSLLMVLLGMKFRFFHPLH